MNKHLASKINLLNLLVSPFTHSLVIGYPNTCTNYIVRMAEETLS